MGLRRSKWLSKPLSAALIEPFLRAVNAEPELKGKYQFSLVDVARVIIGALC